MAAENDPSAEQLSANLQSTLRFNTEQENYSHDSLDFDPPHDETVLQGNVSRPLQVAGRNAPPLVYMKNGSGMRVSENEAIKDQACKVVRLIDEQQAEHESLVTEYETKLHQQQLQIDQLVKQQEVVAEDLAKSNEEKHKLEEALRELQNKHETLITREEELRIKSKEHIDKMQQLTATLEQYEKKHSELVVLASKLMTQIEKITEERLATMNELEQRLKKLEERREQVQPHQAHQDTITSSNDMGSAEGSEAVPVPQEHLDSISMPAKEAMFWPSKELGVGAFGTVYEGQYDGKPCAVKILNSLATHLRSQSTLPLRSKGQLQKKAERSFERERRCLTKISHENVVKLYDIRNYRKGNFPAFFMEKLDCTLTAFLETSDADLSLPTQLSFSCNIASALHYLQDEGIIHCDVCSDNILLDKQRETPIAKVSDFSMSAILDVGKMSAKLTTVGSRAVYYPPEMQDEPQKFYKSTDIFMFGVVMAQIAGKCPTIESKKGRENLILELSESHVMKEHILHCVEPVKNKRPSAKVVYIALKKEYENFEAKANS